MPTGTPAPSSAGIVHSALLAMVISPIARVKAAALEAGPTDETDDGRGCGHGETAEPHRLHDRQISHIRLASLAE